MKKALAVIAGIAMMLFPISAFAAIAFDTGTQAANATNPSVAVTRGTSASNYVGIVSLLAIGASRSSSGCTWGGTSMTQIGTYNDGLVGSGAADYIFAIVNPSSSAGTTVTCATTATYTFVADTFSGVDQVNPWDPNYGGASTPMVTNSNSGATTSFTLSGTSHVDKSVGFMMFDQSGAFPSGGTNTTINSTQATAYNTAAITPAGTTALNITGSSQSFSGGAIALQPAAAAVTVVPTQAGQLILFGDW